MTSSRGRSGALGGVERREAASRDGPPGPFAWPREREPARRLGQGSGAPGGRIGGGRLAPRGERFVLENQIAFLEGELAERAWCLELLEDDNAEIDFLVSLGDVDREPALFLFATNAGRMQRLRGEVTAIEGELRVYRRALAVRAGRCE